MRNIGIFRSVIDLGRCADLLEDSVFHYGNPVRHVQSFFLVVRNVDESNSKLFLEPFELNLHLAAKLEIQRAKRFIKEQNFRLIDQSTRYGNALTLSSGEFRRSAGFKTRQLDKRKSI